MENFVFNYCKDSIKKIKCVYTYKDEVDEKTSWEGYIFTENIDGILNIDGYEKDNMDSLEKNGDVHLRYIHGLRSISLADRHLSFEIYPSKISTIHYETNYNEEDGCFYGIWTLEPSLDHHIPFEDGGKAIIRVEDVDVNEKEVLETIKKVAERSKLEYSSEIKYYDSVNKYGRYNYFGKTPIVKQLVNKMSKYSDKVK